MNSQWRTLLSLLVVLAFVALATDFIPTSQAPVAQVSSADIFSSTGDSEPNGESQILAQLGRVFSTSRFRESNDLASFDPVGTSGGTIGGPGSGASGSAADSGGKGDKGVSTPGGTPAGNTPGDAQPGTHTGSSPTNDKNAPGVGPSTGSPGGGINQPGTQSGADTTGPKGSTPSGSPSPGTSYKDGSNVTPGTAGKQGTCTGCGGDLPGGAGKDTIETPSLLERIWNALVPDFSTHVVKLGTLYDPSCACYKARSMVTALGAVGVFVDQASPVPASMIIGAIGDLNAEQTKEKIEEEGGYEYDGDIFGPGWGTLDPNIDAGRVYADISSGRIGATCAGCVRSVDLSGYGRDAKGGGQTNKNPQGGGGPPLSPVTGFGRSEGIMIQPGLRNSQQRLDYLKTNFGNLSSQVSSDIARYFAPSTSSQTRATIVVLIPNGGETWQVGTKQTISWIYDLPKKTSSYNLGVFLTNGPTPGFWALVTPIATSGIASFNLPKFTISKSGKSQIIKPGQYKVQLVIYDGIPCIAFCTSAKVTAKILAYDQSNSYMKITVPSTDNPAPPIPPPNPQTPPSVSSACEAYLKSLQGTRTDGFWSQFQSMQNRLASPTCVQFLQLNHLSLPGYATSTKGGFEAPPRQGN